MKLKVYADQSCRRDGMPYVTMLYPLWGAQPEDPASPSTGRYDRYTAIGAQYIELSSLEDAHVAVLPMPWEHIRLDREALRLAADLASTAIQARKPVLVFYWSDNVDPVSLENTIVFRTSFFRSRRKANEFAMPAWSEDFVECYLSNSLILRELQDKPVVGFCGQLSGLASVSQSRVHRAADKVFTAFGANKRAQVRMRAVEAFSKSPNVIPNFIIRDRFYTRISQLKDPDNQVTLLDLRREYVDNIVNSDYVICASGGGNFSYRLYEVLSCGRIPIFINTDCVLPYEEWIDWRKYCVWVDESNLELAPEIVSRFHRALSPEEFKERQKACRHLWVTLLSPEGFFSNLHRYFSPQGGTERETN